MTGAFIDWLSFTVPRIHTSRYEISQSVELSIEAVVPEFFTWTPVEDWNWTHGRRPYAEAVGANGILCHHNIKLDNILVEISGQGCKSFADAELRQLISAVRNRITRIDIARDHLGDLNPLEIAKNIPTGRFRSRSQVSSVSGDTAYIGSRKSVQYMRIYRYAKPHPRSELTRVEYVARKEKARKVGEQILNAGIESVYAAIAAQFQLPPELASDAEIADLRLETVSRSESKTHQWILRTCVPAIKKLVDKGEIQDLEAWVKQYLL